MAAKKITCMMTQAAFLTISFVGFQSIAHAQWIPGYQQGQNQNSNDANTYWMNNGVNGNNIPINPMTNSYTNSFSSLALPQNPNNFIGGLANVANINVLNSGTVLTGVLQEDISSKTSKSADIFSIMLPESYTVNDRLLIPQYSKFVGTIVSVSPAKRAHHGNPGNLQVSIQTLVSPDGISIPVNAFIDYNPNQNTKTDLKKSRGVPLDEWGKSVLYSVFYFGGNIVGRMGAPGMYNGQLKGGKDFSLSKGELLPVRLTGPLDVTPLLAGKVQMQTGTQNATRPLLPSMNQNNGLVAPSNAPSGPNNMPDTSNPAGPESF